jgi:hypothetical protein
VTRVFKINFKTFSIIVAFKTETKRGKSALQRGAEMQHYWAYVEAVNLSVLFLFKHRPVFI